MKNSNKKLMISLVTSALFFGGIAKGKTQVILPWKTFGVDARDRSAIAKELLAWQNQIAAAKLSPTPSINLAEFTKAESFSNNVERKLKTILIGAKATGGVAAEEEMIAWSPTLCRIGRAPVVFIHQIDLKTGLLLSVSHAIGSLPSDLNKFGTRIGNWQAAAESALQKSADRMNQVNTDATSKLYLTSSTQFTNLDEASETCLLLLFEEELSKQHRLTSAVGRSELVTARRGLKVEHRQERSNRTIDFQFDIAGATPWQWPINISLKARPAEAIMATPINRIYQGTTTIARMDSNISLSLPPSLNQWLDAENASLSPDTAPKVVYIYGAWAYLDKGRGAGFKIYDRLVGSANPDEVMGHIVGYYGPHLELKNALGHPISEGAIMYVRKGQNKIRVGDPLGPDTTRYPTPWPPAEKAIQ